MVATKAHRRRFRACRFSGGCIGLRVLYSTAHLGGRDPDSPSRRAGLFVTRRALFSFIAVRMLLLCRVMKHTAHGRVLVRLFADDGVASCRAGGAEEGREGHGGEAGPLLRRGQEAGGAAAGAQSVLGATLAGACRISQDPFCEKVDTESSSRVWTGISRARVYVYVYVYVCVVVGGVSILEVIFVFCRRLEGDGVLVGQSVQFFAPVSPAGPVRLMISTRGSKALRLWFVRLCSAPAGGGKAAGGAQGHGEGGASGQGLFAC